MKKEWKNEQKEEEYEKEEEEEEQEEVGSKEELAPVHGGLSISSTILLGMSILYANFPKSAYILENNLYHCNTRFKVQQHIQQ